MVTPESRIVNSFMHSRQITGARGFVTLVGCAVAAGGCGWGFFWEKMDMDSVGVVCHSAKQD